MIVSVEVAAKRLRGGGVVAYPTETVYGLGVDATDPEALSELFRLKGRATESGVSVLVEDAAQLEALAGALPDAARQLARRFWPGPLTLVVDARARSLRAVRTARGVGFRCSSHPVARSLVHAVGRPIVSTSCNRSGADPCTTARDVLEAFGDGMVVADGAPAGGAPPSTVIAIAPDGGRQVLRPGAVSSDEIERELAA